MAITRAQQARQLYRVGGASGREYGANTAASRSVRTSPSRNTMSGGDGGGDGGGNRITSTVKDVVKEVAPFVIGGPFGILSRSDKAKKAFNLFNVFKGLKDFNIITPAGAAELSEDERRIQEEINRKSGYGDTINKVLSDKTAAGGGITDVIPDLSNPEVLNKIAIDAGLPTQKEGFVLKEDVATPESASAIKNIQNLKRNPDLEFKADEIIELGSPLLKDLSDQQIQDVYDMVSLPGQSRIMAAEGGIMDLETGRQMYFLGKLVKKATRAVKKVVKSPIGKAAILGGLTFGIPGVSSGFFSKGLAGTKFGLGAKKFLTDSVFGKVTDLGIFGPNRAVRTGGILDKALGLVKDNPFGAITAASAVAGALTPEQEQEAQQLADNTGIDIEEARNSILQAAKENYAMDVRARGFKADGGIMRAGYQEGSKEPVAKKTMPLLDMGGIEKDYREDGGFVPIGRMERADDVPARLSKNEFVFTADAVRNAGDGDIDKGAEVMYNMMKNLEAGGEVSEESQGLEGARNMFQTSQRLGEVI